LQILSAIKFFVNSQPTIQLLHKADEGGVFLVFKAAKRWRISVSIYRYYQKNKQTPQNINWQKVA